MELFIHRQIKEQQKIRNRFIAIRFQARLQLVTSGIFLASIVIDNLGLTSEQTVNGLNNFAQKITEANNILIGLK